MRPLTAYHIFFQIEREYIIQTAAGEDADKSIHDNKVYLDDVPLRYKNIKLLPDWYAGPGKRQKRKHRKQHGKIGFLELSRVISTRWAQLDNLDPETKAFVGKIAKSELNEYYREMKEYKELTKDIVPSSTQSAVRPTVSKKKTKKRSSKSYLPVQQKQQKSVPYPNIPFSSYEPTNVMPPTSIQFQNDIDYFLSCIDRKTQHLSNFRDENEVQLKRNMPQAYPLYEMPCYVEKSMKKQRTISAPLCNSPTSVEVDICDDEIVQLWKSRN